jgi:hypothetical protein
LVGSTGEERQLSVSVNSEGLAPEIWREESVTDCVPRLFRTIFCGPLDCPAVVEEKLMAAGEVPKVGAWIPWPFCSTVTNKGEMLVGLKKRELIGEGWLGKPVERSTW